MPNPSPGQRGRAGHAAALAALFLAGWVPAAGHAQCGLTNATNWCAHQDSAGVSGGAEDDDRFGAALALGDFDGDGFDDLAVGAPGENNAAGFVFIFYSNGQIPVVAGHQLFSQDQLGGADEGAENGDEFGAALAAGDFDGDGFDDLAIGSPGEDLPESSPDECTLFECEDAGGVHVVYGGAGGIALATAEFVTNVDVSHDASLHEGGRFGATLEAGFLTMPFRDLAIGAPLTLRGDTYLSFGGRDGFDSGAPSFGITLNVGDCSFAHEGFGTSLAMGHFDDGTASLAIGAPACGFNDSVDSEEGAIYLRAFGVLFLFRQTDFPPAGEGVGDHFGAALAAGDFDGNGFDDVAASAPNKNHGAGNPDDSGRVYVAYSDEDGPQPGTAADIIGEDEWAGDTPGTGEHFGSALAGGDVDGDGFDDLLAGAPGEGAFDVGRVYLKRGSGTGLTTVKNALFTQTFLGGSNGDDDHLGNVIALGDVDGDGYPEIALGVPDKDVGTTTDSGMVYVTRAFGRRLFSDGFESGSKAAWSASTP